MTATADLYLDSKEINIHDLSIRYIKGSRSDIIRFERHFNDWELETVENLFNLIKDKKINPLEEDRKAWKLTKDGRFSIKSSFDFLEVGRETSLFPKRLFWNKWVPSKMGFFALEAWW